jgi:hypothetical protein
VGAMMNQPGFFDVDQRRKAISAVNRRPKLAPDRRASLTPGRASRERARRRGAL